MMSAKIELTRIREAYQYMGDEELLTFSKEEGIKLSIDAYLILKEELQKRNIGAAILRDLDHKIILQYSLQQKKFEEDIHKDLFTASLDFALLARHKGVSQYDIYSGLIERGISEAYANYMINKLDEWALKLHKEHLIEMQAGTGIFLLGIVLLVIAITMERLEIPAACLVAVAFGRVLMYWKKKRKYKKLVDGFMQKPIM